MSSRPVMIGVALVVALLLIVLGFALAAGFSGDEILIDCEETGGRVTLKPGQTLAIRLESNPSTGYRWETTEYDVEILRQGGSVEYQSGGSALGAGGHEIFRFEAVATGQTIVKMVYRRPWEESDPLKTFTLEVAVGK